MKPLKKICPLLGKTSLEREMRRDVSVSTQPKYDAYGLIDEQKLAYDEWASRNVDRSVIDRLLESPVVVALAILGLATWPMALLGYLLVGVQ